MGLQLLLGGLIFKNYLRSKAKTSLNISICLLFWGSALFCLALERIYLDIVPNPYFGLGTSVLALILSVIGIIFLNIFSFHIVFPEKASKIRIIPVVLSLPLFMVILISIKDISIIPPTEVLFPVYVDLFLMLIGLSLFFLPAILLLYYSIKVKSTSPPNAQRAFWLGVAIIALILTYIPELLGHVNILRIFYTLGTIIFYFCFTRYQELSWPQKIRHLYIILPEKGISLYEQHFIEEELVDDQFFASTLAGFSSMIQKFIKTSKKLRIIDHEDVKIMMEHGEKVVGILVTEIDYRILRKKLLMAVQTFEKKFQTDLIEFSGTLKKFKTAKGFIDEIFSFPEPQ